MRDHLVPRLLFRVRWVLLSVPIYTKVLGIGALMAILFGGVVLHNVRGSMAQTLYENLERTSLATAESLSRRLERAMAVQDLFSVQRDLRRTMAILPEVRYVIVEDARGRIVGHTFGTGVPGDLMRVAPHQVPSGGATQVLGSAEGLIVEATAPILEGGAGRVRVGVMDRVVTRELSSMTRSVLWTLAVCLLVATSLGLLLTYVISRPVYRLVVAVDRIRAGDFDSEAEVLSGDEIGRLAVAFNRMREALNDYRREVEEKEAARRALIERIVLAQEEERQRIAHELHDQIGQSLSTLLLSLQATPRDDQIPNGLHQQLEEQVYGVIEDVRRLAWNMRPSILDDYGLESALGRHVQEVSKRFGLPVDYQCTTAGESGRLPGRIEVALYRIAQEALANVRRHAEARRVSVVLLRQPAGVTLLVEDDGIGFEPSSVRESAEPRLGLIGMEERAALLGGSFVAESVPGIGTTVRVTIPLGESDYAHPRADC